MVKTHINSKTDMARTYLKTAQQALLENIPKRCRGRPKTQWIDKVKKQLEQLNVTYEDANSGVT